MRLIRLIKEMFTVKSFGDFAFVTVFWLVLIIGGSFAVQSVGQYLLGTNPELANKFGIAMLIIILLALSIDPIIQVCRDIKRDGGFFIKRR